MTTPNEDPAPLAEIETALATLKTAILDYFESNPPDEHRQLDKDELRTQVLTRIQQQSNVPAQAATAHAALGTKAQPQKPAPHATTSANSPTHPTAPQHPAAAAKHADQPAPGPTGQQDPELSGAHWAKVFPSLGNDIKHLDGDFGQRVADFKTAMENAGIEVQIHGARRSPQRAYLMHWSYKIVKEGVSGQEADLPKNKREDVNIRWAHTDQHGAYDPKASIAAAQSLYEALGVAHDLAVEPSLTSNHITGRAVDMTTTWHKPSITIRRADNIDVVITTTSDSERTDTNPDLHEVADSYGIIHFASQKGAKLLPQGDKNHWSYDGR